MFVPVVPVVPHTTVINKTIVYSDTVLPLKDSGSNLKVTSISNVNEFSLEKCLKTIFESNPNVIFNTIQYSKNDKKVYFYTNEVISTKEYEESKITKYKPISSSTEILEELKNIFVAERNKDNDCVSLYDVLNLLKKENYQYKNKKESYESQLDYLINNKYDDVGIIVYGFDYDTNELRIGFRYFKNYDKLNFTKKNGDLFITQSETYRGNDVLAVLGDTLSKLYDEFEKYRNFEKQYNYGFKSINSNFLIDVSKHGVSIYSRNKDTYSRDFELNAYSYKSEYEYKCNSNVVLSSFYGKETEVLKRIFVRIEDCPEWSQTILFEIRQNQLAEEQKVEDEIKYKEMKKQKRLELTRKIFPFLKK